MWAMFIGWSNDQWGICSFKMCNGGSGLVKDGSRYMVRIVAEYSIVIA